MKKGICRRLAFENIKKNYRFFIPRILTETGLLACFYIIYTLACDGRLAQVKGGDYIPTFMWMGAVIIGLLSFVLLLYTNSFLMKQRKREFGLYSVLGMEKKHICRVLFFESLICTVISVIVGLVGGILFYKLSSLAICRLLKSNIIAGFYFITPGTAIPPCLIFIGIDVFAFIVNCADIARMKPTELLSSKAAGEKEPKVKWLLLVLGLLTLGGGYYISLTTKNPLKAMLLFFAAVLLVIIGTYFLYIAGSVFILKALKKNDKYYYKPGNITAVSGLLYRMKQNAVGLASVAILATGVLVMISSTFCLYTRTENTIRTQYPQDFHAYSVFYVDDGQRAVDIPEELLDEIAREGAEKSGLEIKETYTQRFFEVDFTHLPGELVADGGYITELTDTDTVCNITFITEEMYVKLGGEPLGLEKDEVAVCGNGIDSDFNDSSFTLFGKNYKVAKESDFFPIGSGLFTVNSFGMVVSDGEVFDEIFKAQENAYGSLCAVIQGSYCVNFKDRNFDDEAGARFAAHIQSSLHDYIFSEGYTSFSTGGIDGFWMARNRLYGMYGTLLFLGILLGTVCLFATVLIIYYKQISEGYEDRDRYQIMRKIGMTDSEVKKTVRRQMTLVFFLPLVTAGIHIAFAFPMLTRLMRVMLLDNVWSFAKWCIIVYAVFAVVYAVIYRLTARTYYRIVY